MIAEAMQWIKDHGPAEIIEHGDKPYIRSSGSIKPLLESFPDPIQVKTLTGLSDYLDGPSHELSIAHALDDMLVHVDSFAKVTLCTQIFGAHRQRFDILVATSEPPRFPFGQYLDHETFMIQLRTQFVQDEETAGILQLIGNIKDEAVKTFADDGISQVVSTKSGIARVAEMVVKNPCILRPYRTFLEIEQPASEFLLRMKSGKDGTLPSVALYEADGGRWKIEAMQRIKAWLSRALPTAIPIIC